MKECTSCKEHKELNFFYKNSKTNIYESRFTEGMSWDNYGEWHIDHIRPLASFNLLEENEVKLACHYTNLQPLWARDNLSKGGSYRLTKK